MGPRLQERALAVRTSQHVGSRILAFLIISSHEKRNSVLCGQSGAKLCCIFISFSPRTATRARRTRTVRRLVFQFHKFCGSCEIRALSPIQCRSQDQDAPRRLSFAFLNSNTAIGAMRTRTLSSVVALLHSISSGCSALLLEDDGGGGPHFDLFDFPFADPVTWAADSSNDSNGLGGFQGENSRF